MFPGYFVYLCISFQVFWSCCFKVQNVSCRTFNRHMNTIELQLEVTRFLHRCESATAPKAPKAPQTSTTSSKSSGSSSLPTLFGGSPTKIEVACKVKFWSWSPHHLCVRPKRAGGGGLGEGGPHGPRDLNWDSWK